MTKQGNVSDMSPIFCIEVHSNCIQLLLAPNGVLEPLDSTNMC